MAKKKREVVEVLTDEECKELLVDYEETLETDPKYSLKVDPQEKYNMSELQKSFVETYCEVKSVPVTAELLRIGMDVAMELFNMYSSKKEIDRISLAKLHRRIKTKMWDYEEIGGFLTTLLTDENVPLADRLHSKDKVGVARMLIDLNDRKREMYQNPIDAAEPQELEEQLKNLSVDTIKALLKQDSDNDEKAQVMKHIKSKIDLNEEEEDVLNSMELPELLKFLNECGS